MNRDFESTGCTYVPCMFPKFLKMIEIHMRPWDISSLLFSLLRRGDGDLLSE